VYEQLSCTRITIACVRAISLGIKHKVVHEVGLTSRKAIQRVMISPSELCVQCVLPLMLKKWRDTIHERRETRSKIQIRHRIQSGASYQQQSPRSGSSDTARKVALHCRVRQMLKETLLSH
jgi:hypothetical protein